MKRQETDGLTVNLNGNVVITAAQYREYKELQAKKDRTIASLRAQMKLQEAEWSKAAVTLAKEITSSMIGDGKLGVTIVNQPAAAKAYELAQELLRG